MNTPRIALTFGLLLAASFVAILVSLRIGSVDVRWGDVWSAVAGSGEGLARTVIAELRLPRALIAFAAGGVLAIAGALMQVLLRNPLADPYVMGVSGGAAVAALAAMLVGATGLAIDVGATAGALITMFVVFALAHSGSGWTPTRLLLIGVIVAAGANAAVSTLLALGDETQLRGMLFWLMGDLSIATNPKLLFAVFIVALLVIFPFARQLNVLSRGEIEARVLGAPVRPLRIAIFVASSVLTAVCVTTAGTIGFVGLVTPHISRLVVGSDHRFLLPASALLGGTLVALADLGARSLFAPRQLPVGALTAFVGVPLFLILARRSNKR